MEKEVRRIIKELEGGGEESKINIQRQRNICSTTTLPYSSTPPYCWYKIQSLCNMTIKDKNNNFDVNNNSCILHNKL